VEEELVKIDESRTSGISSVRGGDEFDRSPFFNQKAMSLLPSQGDFRAIPGAGRIGEGVRNRANGCR